MCVPTEMFYSMGHAGMTSSVTSVRSASELSDSDMESSIHSLASFTQPVALSAQVRCLRLYNIKEFAGDQKKSNCCYYEVVTFEMFWNLMYSYFT